LELAVNGRTRRTQFRLPTRLFVVALGASLLLCQSCDKPAASGARSSSSSSATKQFFSDDDGKTWFMDDASKLPPIDHGGKQAYRARVFKCAGGKPFVGYLERYDPRDQQRSEEAARAAERSGGSLMPGITIAGNPEVKKPGDSEWVRLTPETSEKYNRIMQPRCPDGSTVGLQPVLPE
jgi:hypothetical protein